MAHWLQAFIPKLLGRAHVTAYVTGNIGVGAAADLARRVQSLLSDQLKTRPPFPSQVPKTVVVAGNLGPQTAGPVLHAMRVSVPLLQGKWR